MLFQYLSGTIICQSARFIELLGLMKIAAVKKLRKIYHNTITTTFC